MQYINKYQLEFSKEDFRGLAKYLTNQLWKLIPMREKGEDYKKQLNTVKLEIVGLNEIFIGPLFLNLLSKIEGLLIIDTDFELYRKTVFECINIVQELNRNAAI